MLDIQNRLPTPGKENRVKITQDSGAVVEGVLSYADEATQDGTYWNRKNGQLLQGDIREYPVRDGQTIRAGDVVNYGSQIISGGQKYGDLPVGSTIQLKENGVLTDYIVVHQGLPDDMYDPSCDGTWVWRKENLPNSVAWGRDTVYSGCKAFEFLQGTFMAYFDGETLAKIKTVKIPYNSVVGSSPYIETVSCKAFDLSARELGVPGSIASPNDGAKLSYFSVTGAADDKRAATNQYHTRTSFDATQYAVNPDGSPYATYKTVESASRPCFILDSSAYIDTPVYGPKEVYREVTPQANVENVLESGSVTDSFVMSARDNFNIVGFKRDYNVTLYIVDNNGEKLKSSIFTAFSLTSAVSSCGIYKLSENEFVVYCICSTNLYAKIGTISGTSISFGSQYTVASSVSNSADIIALSDTIALAIYNSSGLKCKVLPISGTTITTSGAVYSLPNNTRASYISACKLPDEGGNKRVCICFSDTGDGNKGKAVIATIDSSNAVTFGEVKTIVNSAITSIDLDTDGNNLLFNTSDSLVLADLDLNILDTETSTSGAVQNVSPYTYVLLGVDNNACVVTTNDGTIAKGAAYAVNGGANTNYPSLVATSENGVVAAYSDAGNSNYGTTTVLEVLGNQIAGSFIDNSKDAIALASGNGGDTIPVGFGGYCQCDGVTEGQEILSDGVSAFSPLDGWLMIAYAQEKQCVTGEYTGYNVYPFVIDVGFTPSFVFLQRVESGTTVVYTAAVNGCGKIAGFTNTNQANITFLDNGVSIDSNWNSSGYKYYYAAWR